MFVYDKLIIHKRRQDTAMQKPCLRDKIRIYGMNESLFKYKKTAKNPDENGCRDWKI